jgi:trypsin
LTLAFCVVGRSPSDIIVRVGTKFNARGGELFRVSYAIVFPRYNNVTYDNDIAILQLEKSIVMQSKVKEVIALPSDGENIADGTPVIVSGWGDTANDKDSNRMLRAVELKTKSLESCSRTFPSLSVSMICAGTDEGGKAACTGKLFNINL